MILAAVFVFICVLGGYRYTSMPTNVSTAAVNTMAPLPTTTNRPTQLSVTPMPTVVPLPTANVIQENRQRLQRMRERWLNEADVERPPMKETSPPDEPTTFAPTPVATTLATTTLATSERTLRDKNVNNRVRPTITRRRLVTSPTATKKNVTAPWMSELTDVDRYRNRSNLEHSFLAHFVDKPADEKTLANADDVQLLVMSPGDSGQSLVARLLMLMGFYGGERSEFILHGAMEVRV
jgi:hypothetical protein